MLTKDLLNCIALKLDLVTLTKFCRVCKRFTVDDNFWRLKLVEYGMLDVSKENIPDPKEAYRQIISDKNLLSTCEVGYLYRLKYLLETNDDIARKRGALINAVANGHLELVKYLVEQRNSQYNSETCYWSVRFGHFEIMKYLVEIGCDYDEAACLNIADHYGHTDIKEYLIAKRNARSLSAKI